MFKHKVRYTEHDSWSGTERWFRYFDSRELAEHAVKLENDQNNLPVVPEYYITADYVGIVEGTLASTENGKETFKEFK